MDVAVNIKHLKARLVQSKYINDDFKLNKESLIVLLENRFNEVDFETAKQDVAPFISDISKLDLWTKKFFKDITKSIKVNK